LATAQDARSHHGQAGDRKGARAPRPPPAGAEQPYRPERSLRRSAPPRFRRPRSVTTGARERAEPYAEAAQEREDETREHYNRKLKLGRAAEEKKRNDGARGATGSLYFKRFLAQNESSGKVRRIRDLESAWNTWLAEPLGGKLIASISRDDAEDVRDVLDAEVAKRKKLGPPHGISGDHAANVWSGLTSMMKEACTSKRRDLRVRSDNPCAGVQPPEKTEARAKTFVYPSEFLTLVACPEVPTESRELYAVACYLYLRPGERRALLWGDVDFCGRGRPRHQGLRRGLRHARPPGRVYAIIGARGTLRRVGSGSRRCAIVHHRVRAKRDESRSARDPANSPPLGRDRGASSRRTRGVTSRSRRSTARGSCDRARRRDRSTSARGATPGSPGSLSKAST